jgi:transcriptional regulator of acetoin/glycerol metabolism
VFDPHGELLAVLDVSRRAHDVSRQSQFHTMALVNLSAKMIESCYFLRHFETNGCCVSFAGRIGRLVQRRLAGVRRRGRICAVNQSALNLLGQIRGGLLGKPVEAFFDCSLDELLAAPAPMPRQLAAAHPRWAAVVRRLRGQSRKPAVAPARPVQRCRWRASAWVTRRCKVIFARRCGCSSATCRC